MLINGSPCARKILVGLAQFDTIAVSLANRHKNAEFEFAPGVASVTDSGADMRKQVSEAHERMVHIAEGLSFKIGPSHTIDALIGAALAVLRDVYGKQIASEYLRDVAAQLEADEPTVGRC